MRAGAATTQAIAKAHGQRWKAAPTATRQATATTAAGTTNTGCSETSVPTRSTEECSKRTARTTVPPTRRTAATRRAVGSRTTSRIPRPTAGTKTTITWLFTQTSLQQTQHVDVNNSGNDQPARG